MESVKIIQLTKDNISAEHICCAISDKKCSNGYNAKKQWLKNQFKDGYVFKKVDVRGKVFIEYVAAENGWLPIDAPGYMLINCFWVSGQYKGKGFGKALYRECEKDTRGMNGIVAVAAHKKQPFMSEKKFYQKNGFQLCDTAQPYFELWYKPFKKEATVPSFKACAKHGACDYKDGLSVYYTDACPFTDYYVHTELKRVAKKRSLNLHIKKFETKEQA